MNLRISGQIEGGYIKSITVSSDGENFICNVVEGKRYCEMISGGQEIIGSQTTRELAIIQSIVNESHCLP